MAVPGSPLAPTVWPWQEGATSWLCILTHPFRVPNTGMGSDLGRGFLERPKNPANIGNDVDFRGGCLSAAGVAEEG